MKKLILVTSPPACGKTFVSKQLAKSLKHVVYLDKDTLIPLSKQIFAVANEEYNRSSPFFEQHIRDYEYEAILALAFEALDYENLVLINAPFTREIRNLEYIKQLRTHLAQKKADLVVIWVETDPEVCRQRMFARNSDRDTWKLQNWDTYIKNCNFNVPDGIKLEEQDDSLLIFKNSSDAEFKESMQRITAQLDAAGESVTPITVG